MKRWSLVEKVLDAVGEVVEEGEAVHLGQKAKCEGVGLQKA